MTLAETVPPAAQPTVPEVFERMRLIQAAAGFLPVTIEETHRAANLLGGRNAGTKHLHEVGRHQQKADDTEEASIDPNQGMTRVLWTMGRYAIDARSSAFMLGRLHEDIFAASRLERTIAEETADMRAGFSVEYPFGFRHGLPEFIRFRDLRTYVFGGGRPNGVDLLAPVLDSDGYVLGDPYTVAPNTDNMQNYFGKVYSRLRLREVRDTLPAAIDDQHSREYFWVDKLANVALYPPNENIGLNARRILAGIHIAKKAKA